MEDEISIGSSGVQFHFEMDFITDGIRLGRVVPVLPAFWPDLHIPHDEYLKDSGVTHENRFPTADIFPKYGR
jgi:hypothetical protein